MPKQPIICTRWAFDLAQWPTPSMAQLCQAVAAVQPEERVRLMKFHFLDDFLSSLVGRLLMRKYVSQASGLSFKEVRFARDKRGKPYWIMPITTPTMPKLSFNVSHQGNFVVLAGVRAAADTGPDDVAKKQEAANASSSAYGFGVGVDVMKIEYSGGKPLQEFFRLMHRNFSEEEWQHIRNPHHNESDQLKAFMRNWCLKEAYVKEMGVGITINLQKVSFAIPEEPPLTIEGQPMTQAVLRFNDEPMHDWHFEEHLLHPRYCAAIAYRNCQPDEVGKFEILALDDLLVTDKFEDGTADSCKELAAYCRLVLSKDRKKL